MRVTKRALSLLIALLLILGTAPAVAVSADEELYLCEVVEMTAQYDVDTETMTYSGTCNDVLQPTRTYVFFLNCLDSKGNTVNVTISNVKGADLDPGNGSFSYSFRLAASEVTGKNGLFVEFRCNDNNVLKPHKEDVVVVDHYVSFVATEGGSLIGKTLIGVADGTALSTLVFPTPVADEGYVFKRWTYTEGIVNSDITLTASFVKDESLWTTVTFTCGVGGVLEGDAEIDALIGASFDSITVPTPTAMDGYAFAGWDKSFPDTVTEGLAFNASFDYLGDAPVSLGITSATYGGGYITVKGDAYLVADQWDIAFRLIDGEGGSTLTMNTVKYSDIKTDGGYEYKFKVNPDDMKGDMYVGVKLVSVPLAGETLSVSVATYTVTFKGHDGTVIDTQTVEHGASATAPEAPVVEGYHFVDWDKAFDSVTENIEINAVYEINVYTVTFTGVDGVVLDTQSVEHGGAATAPDPEREGYSFIRWDKSFDVVTEDLTVGAIYEVNTYTVTFKGHDGTVIDTQTVEHGASATAPEAPVVEGYHFVDWDKAFDSVTENIEINAVYEINVYTVTFTGVDGVVLDTQSVEHGGAATAPDPEREGYSFIRWDKSFDVVTEDLTVGAIYEVKTYTVTFKNHDGTVIGTQTVEHGASATAPEVPERDGYVFAGWDGDYSIIKADVSLTARFVLLGDVNLDGRVDNLDSAYILRHDAAINLLTGDALIAADANADGTVSALDAAHILRYDAGLINKI